MIVTTTLTMMMTTMTSMMMTSDNHVDKDDGKDDDKFPLLLPATPQYALKHPPHENNGSRRQG